MVFYSFINENSGHAEEHSAAHQLLADVLKKHYGISEFRLEIGERGKPFLPEYPDIHFNISHCSGLAVCGISADEIGVDAELIRSYKSNVMKRIFSPEERELVAFSAEPEKDFFRIWTLKEALGKYFGTGIFSDLSRYSFSFEGEIPICKNAEEGIFTQKILQRKWVVSICAHNPENDFIFMEYQ